MENWVVKNREAFERDVLQDFCLASDQFFDQFSRVDETLTISFPVLRSLVGEPLNKGLLWRLKDKAHHVFRKAAQGNPVALLLDWTLGYIFHESLKLMEDAHQRQYYAPQLDEIARSEQSAEAAELTRSLLAIQEETCESMRREATRLATLLLHSRRLFCLYFAGCSMHRPLARFIYDNKALLLRVFQDEYESLILSVYGREPERLSLEAAYSLLESARFKSAAAAVEEALSLNPSNQEALSLKEKQAW